MDTSITRLEEHVGAIIKVSEEHIRHLEERTSDELQYTANWVHEACLRVDLIVSSSETVIEELEATEIWLKRELDQSTMEKVAEYVCHSMLDSYYCRT